MRLPAPAAPLYHPRAFDTGACGESLFESAGKNYFDQAMGLRRAGHRKACAVEDETALRPFDIHRLICDEIASGGGPRAPYIHHRAALLRADSIL